MLRVLTLWALVILYSGALAEPADVGTYPLLQDEISRLEEARAMKSLTPELVGRLGELYFLTSRCRDAKRLREQVGLVNGRLLDPIVCACALGCSAKSPARYSELERYKKLLRSPKIRRRGWNGTALRKVWPELVQTPEGRYWADKFLRENRDFGKTSLRELRLELERSLEGLEVR